MKVLVLNGSFCEIPLIEECHKLGHYVVTTGNMPQLEGHACADEYIKADYSDYKAILDIVRARSIGAVLTCANDFGAITAAYVDEKMGWCRHDTYEHAKRLHQKDLFKDYMMANGYPVPWSKAFASEEDAIQFVKETKSYPVIVKANDLTGGKGVHRADSPDQAVVALQEAFARSRSKHVVVEQFVEGRQQTFVTFLHERKVVAYTGCDSFSYVNPYLIQSETLPSVGIDDVKDELIRIIESIAVDLKLADGIFAFQYMKVGSDVCIFEMMRRPFGNQFLRLVEYNTDFPWHLAQVIVETGGDWAVVRRKPVDKCFCGHFGVMATRNGTLAGYSIPADILSHVYKRFDMKKVGEKINDFENERVTFLHFEYDDAATMQREVATYYNRIKVEVQ